MRHDIFIFSEMGAGMRKDRRQGEIVYRTKPGDIYFRLLVLWRTISKDARLTPKGDFQCLILLGDICFVPA